jgi:hypothetical protein
VAADGDVHGEDTAQSQRLERLADQRRLAVSARRDQEHLLPVAQVGHQAQQLRFPSDERIVRNDLAVDEWIIHGRWPLRISA